MPCLQDLEFASLPVGNDVVDGRYDVEFDVLSEGWRITEVWVLDARGRLIYLHPEHNSYRHVRNCLYAYRGDQTADAVREARAEEAV